MNFLQLVNDVLNKTGEVTLNDVTNTRGVQTVAVNAVNNAIHDIINAELEWPFNVQSGSQLLTPGEGQYDLPSDYRTVDWLSFFVKPTDLITNGTFDSDITSWTDVSVGAGTIAHDATNLRMTLTGDGSDPGAAEQSLSVIAAKKYSLVFRHFTTDLALRIGTTSGGTEILSDTLVVTDLGNGQFHNVEFTVPSAVQTVYVGFYNTSATAVGLDTVSCKRSERPRSLRLLNLDEYTQRFKWRDDLFNVDDFEIPIYVYYTLDNKFGVTSLPDEAWTVIFNYWNVPSDLSVNADETVIPAQYHHIISARAIYYVLSLRSDPAFVDRAEKQYLDGIRKMRSELINKKTYMYPRQLYTKRPNTASIRFFNG